MRYLLFALLIISTSCKKEYSCEKCIGIDYKNATVVDGGDVALDGCGWLIKIDNILYHPDVLDSSFLQNNFPVKVISEPLPGKFTCGLGPLELDIIHIISIVK